MISNRHIRHDWKTWVDWDQISVRTVCGVTTRMHLAGVPGITPQPPVVTTSAGKRWGWCTVCVMKAYFEQVPLDVVHPDIKERYITFRAVIYPQYTAYVEAKKAGKFSRKKFEEV
jgi:hypothetical protein